MNNEAAAIVARARSLIGTRFRPQGRSRDQGLDCIGLVMLATETPPAGVPDDYHLRDGDTTRMNAAFDASGFFRLPVEQAEAGDVLVARSGPGQLHTLILTLGGYVHAHAGLRRIVEAPGTPPWPVLAAWRRSSESLLWPR